MDYTVGSVRRTSDFTRTANFTITGVPEVYRYGLLTTVQYNGRNLLTAANVEAALTNTGNDFVAPQTFEYDGGSVSAQLYAALYIPDNITISRVSSEGFIFDTETVDFSTEGYTLHIVNAPLSNGVHEVTWR